MAAFYRKTSTTENTLIRPRGLEKPPWGYNSLHILNLEYLKGSETISKLVKGASLCKARKSSLPGYFACRNVRNGELEEDTGSHCSGKRLSFSDSGRPARFPVFYSALTEQRWSGALLQLQWKLSVWLPLLHINPLVALPRAVA